MIVCALVVLGTPTVQGQSAPSAPYDQDSQDRPRYSGRRELVALQDDLQLLDESLNALSPRHRRYPEFQRRADAIRQNVVALADDIRQRREDRQDRREDRREDSREDRPAEDQDYRREDRPAGGGRRAEIAVLRQNIAELRNDMEDAMRRGRRGGNSAFVVPAGTEIEVMLDQDLSSRSSNPDDRASASTVAAVRLDGRTVIPAGATVSGFVREVRSRDRGQSDGWLKVDFDRLTPEGGPEMPMRSHIVSISERRSGDNRLRNGGLGALLGSVVGGIIDGRKGALIGAAVGAGGGLLASRGDDVDLPEGTLLMLRLDRPMTFARR
jgi:hypothetical protein